MGGYVHEITHMSANYGVVQWSRLNSSAICSVLSQPDDESAQSGFSRHLLYLRISPGQKTASCRQYLPSFCMHQGSENSR